MIQQNDLRDLSLANQYEAYPYPQRNPSDEHTRLLVGSPSHLREIDYWVFGSTRPMSTPLRALIAGCGTGDGAIMLATHLTRANRSGEVICLDRSRNALAIAHKRAKIRQLKNIKFIEGDLTQSSTFKTLGNFDYIDCCGVLHHLPHPAETLRLLVNQLNPNGGMGLMVYAPYGRTGVYMLQDALQSLAPLTWSPQERLDIARRVMRTLPITAWLRQNGNFGDHFSGGDSGLYDLLLNPRDRAYTITKFLALLDEVGLETTALMEPARYNPTLFLPDVKIRRQIATLSWHEQVALAENLCGNMATHIAYVVRKGQKPPRLDPLSSESIPIMREIPGIELTKQIRPDNILPFAFGTLVVPIALPPQARGILPLIDGVRTVGEIAQILAERGVNHQKFQQVWHESFCILESLNRVLLRPLT